MRAVIAIAALILAGCAGSGSKTATTDERELTPADAESVVPVVPGQTLVLRVASNASTGYSWTWDEAAAAGVLAQEGAPTMSALEPQRVGSGGTQTWRFRAIKPGDATLRMDYRRAWEADQPSAQTLRWRIQVR